MQCALLHTHRYSTHSLKFSSRLSEGTLFLHCLLLNSNLDVALPLTMAVSNRFIALSLAVVDSIMMYIL
jgi:hypothetical protein